MTGTVKFFNESKGFGFITNDETGEDVFVHVSALDGLTLREGAKVTYVEEEGKKGGGLVLIIAIVLGVLLVIGITIGATLFLAGFFDPPPEESAQEQIDKAQAEVENYTNLYVEIPVYNSFFVRAGMALSLIHI